MGSLCHKALQIISELCLGGQVEREKCAGIFPLETARQGIGGTGTGTGPAAPGRRARPAAAAAGRAAPAWAAGERNFFLCLPCVRRGRRGGSHTARFKIVSPSQPAEAPAPGKQREKRRDRRAAAGCPPRLGWGPAPRGRTRGRGRGCRHGAGERGEAPRGEKPRPACEPRRRLEPRLRRRPLFPAAPPVAPRAPRLPRLPPAAPLQQGFPRGGSFSSCKARTRAVARVRGAAGKGQCPMRRLRAGSCSFRSVPCRAATAPRVVRARSPSRFSPAAPPCLARRAGGTEQAGGRRPGGSAGGGGGAGGGEGGRPAGTAPGAPRAPDAARRAAARRSRALSEEGCEILRVPSVSRCGRQESFLTAGGNRWGQGSPPVRSRTRPGKFGGGELGLI